MTLLHGNRDQYDAEIRRIFATVRPESVLFLVVSADTGPTPDEEPGARVADLIIRSRLPPATLLAALEQAASVALDDLTPEEQARYLESTEHSNVVVAAVDCPGCGRTIRIGATCPACAGTLIDPMKGIQW